MRVAVLLEDWDSILTVRRALRWSGLQRGGADLHILGSWEEALGRAGDAVPDLVIVQTDFPDRGSFAGSEVRRLERLMAVFGHGGMILYARLDRPAGNWGEGLPQHLSRHLLLNRIDNDPVPILRAMARAMARKSLHSCSAHDGRMRELVEDEFFWLPLAGWPPPKSVPDRARRLRVSERTLRRGMVRRGLPGPKKMIRWGQLLEVCAFWEMGVNSRTRLTSILGGGNPSFVTRLCRDLVGHGPEVMVGRHSRDTRREDSVGELLGRLLTSDSKATH